MTADVRRGMSSARHQKQMRRKTSLTPAFYLSNCPVGWFLHRDQEHFHTERLQPLSEREGIRVVAEQLARWPHDREVDEDLFLKRCLGFGEQQVLQAKLHSAESVTLELFRNALKLAAHKGLLSGTGRDVHERRKAFATQLRQIVDDLETLSRMQGVHR